MKKILLTLFLVLSLPAMAGQDNVTEQIHYLQTNWAKINYQMPDKDVQSAALEKLGERAQEITNAYPNRAEPKIWQAIILSTKAGVDGGLGALGEVKQAKALLEKALKQNPRALDGSAYTSLGSIYYKVPRWPVGFGDNGKAEKNLKMALQINPNGIDPNFFYGDFLIKDGRADEAKIYLEKALKAPSRPNRPLADAGRRQEVKAKLAEINKTATTKDTPKYN